MQLPFEILIGIFTLTIALALIGVWKKVPFAMFIGGALLVFIFLLTEEITALGDTQTCTTVSASTTCEFEPYVLDVWVKLIFMILGSIFMITGALIWKATEE